MVIKECYEVDFDCVDCSTVIKVSEQAFSQIKDGFALHHDIICSHPKPDEPFSDDLPEMLETHWYYKTDDGLLVHFGHTVTCVAYRGDFYFKEDLDL